MSNCKTFAIDANSPIRGDGGATLCGFVPTGSDSDSLLATVSGWQPNGGSHPTVMFVKRATQTGRAGIWFRVNFVGDMPNGITWVTFFQGGNPSWPAEVQPTAIRFNSEPWH